MGLQRRGTGFGFRADKEKKEPGFLCVENSRASARIEHANIALQAGDHDDIAVPYCELSVVAWTKTKFAKAIKMTATDEPAHNRGSLHVILL
jgi:hypothetical protein